MITQQQLKEILRYDSSTGTFFWIKPATSHSRVIINGEAGSKHSRGYVHISVYGKEYKAHRLAWLYVYGEWPKGEIDHINGVKDDNRISNLRDVDRTTNCQNLQGAYKTNKLDCLGVSKRGKKYFAQIQVNKKKLTVGTFDTLKAANAAYQKAKAALHN